MDPLPFVTGEEKGPIRTQWSTEIGAELMLTKRRNRLAWIVEKVSSVKCIVAHELQRAAVKLIAARLGHDVDEGRCLAAKLRGVHRFLNLELLNRIDRRAEHEVIEELV